MVDESTPVQGTVELGARRAATYGLNARTIVGIVMVALGTLWTLDNFGLLDASSILRFWPIVLIVLGIQRLTGMGARHTPVWGTVLVAGGATLLSHNLGWIHFGAGAVWALGLIAVGVMLLRPSRMGPFVFVRGSGSRFSRRFRKASDVHIGVGETVVSDDPAATLQVFSMWSHVIRRIISQEFVGGDVAAIMGGVKIDLRSAKPAPGGAVLDLAVIWGGVEILVPSTWQIVHEASVVIGGISDHTHQTVNDSRDRLTLRGAVIMGGVELRN